MSKNKDLMDVIADIICQGFSVSHKELCGSRRYRQLAYARHFFFHMCLYRAGIQDTVIADFKKRYSEVQTPWNRTSVIHGANRIADGIDVYPQDKNRYEAINKALEKYCVENDLKLAHSKDLIYFDEKNISVA